MSEKTAITKESVEQQLLEAISLLNSIVHPIARPPEDLERVKCAISNYRDFMDVVRTNQPIPEIPKKKWFK